MSALLARGALAAAAIAVLLMLAAWLRASGHEATAARLAGTDPAAMSRGAAEQALAELRAAERAQPDAGPTQARAVILLARGQTAAAARAFEAVVAAEPRNGLAWGYLSRTLRELDPERAAEARRRGLELLPRVRRR